MTKQSTHSKVPFPSTEAIDFHGIKWPLESLYAHTLICGTTGSGKTRTVLRPMIRQLLALHADDVESKCGMLVIDPKGLDLLPVVEEALGRYGRQDDLAIIGPGEHDATWNPLADTNLRPSQVTHMILAATSALGQGASQKSRSGERFWEGQDRALLTALVNLAGNAIAETSRGQALTFEHLNRFRTILSQPEPQLREWAAEIVSEIGTTQGMPLIEFAALPESTRGCVAASIGALLDHFARPPLSSVVQPDPNRPSVDLRSILEEGKVVVVNTSRAESALDLLPVQILLAMAWSRLVLARPRLGKNMQRPVWTVIDEAARVISPHGDPASDIMDMARASKCGVILALQNLSALHTLGDSYAVHRLAALAANHVYLANSDPVTAAEASATLGTKREYRLHRQINYTPPPPLFFPTDFDDDQEIPIGVMVPTDQPVLPATEMAKLSRGEMFLLVSGEVHHIHADVAAP